MLLGYVRLEALHDHTEPRTKQPPAGQIKSLVNGPPAPVDHARGGTPVGVKTCVRLRSGRQLERLNKRHMSGKAMRKFSIARGSDPVIAIDGGVALDIVGFAASLSPPSNPYICMPTTALSHVDAPVGRWS